MNKSVLLILFLFVGVVAFAQKTKNVSASYTYYAPETMSIEEAKRTALERAKIQAIADEFGTIVSQSSSTIVSNKNGESDTKFFSVGGSDVKGEWIETFGEPKYDISFEDHLLVVSVALNGKIRQIPEGRAIIDSKILRNGVDLRNEDDTFGNGDDLFLSFKSSLDGYLLIYLLDYQSSNAYCLLPYKKSKDTAQKIDQNENYIFFSRSHAPGFQDGIVDEYTLTNSGADNVEHNDIVMLFSPKMLVKGTSEDNGEGYPRQMSLDTFEKWRSQIISNPEVQIIKKGIYIQQ